MHLRNQLGIAARPAAAGHERRCCGLHKLQLELASSWSRPANVEVLPHLVPILPLQCRNMGACMENVTRNEAAATKRRERSATARHAYPASSPDGGHPQRHLSAWLALDSFQLSAISFMIHASTSHAVGTTSCSQRAHGIETAARSERSGGH
jgi:hypothetical protein